jgi:hypothetical protein
VSFEEFVHDCSPRLFRTALLLAGQDRAAAEDLLQLALERAYRHWARVCRSGDPIRFGSDCHLPQQPPSATFDNIVFTPDGKTAYVTCGSAVVPISTATNTPGKPIRPGPFVAPQTIAITP